jgi:hypothetical protein
MRDSLEARLREVLTDAEAQPVPKPTRREWCGRAPGQGRRRHRQCAGRQVVVAAEPHAPTARRGVPRSRILHIEFEDDRLAELRTEDLHRIEEAFFAMHPEVMARSAGTSSTRSTTRRRWVAFSVRRLLTANRNLHLAITGSVSAKLLSTGGFADEPAGRSLTTEVLPFSFRGGPASIAGSTYGAMATFPGVRGRLRSELERYLTVGGFPEVQDDDPHRQRILQGYLDVYDPARCRRAPLRRQRPTAASAGPPPAAFGGEAASASARWRRT